MNPTEAMAGFLPSDVIPVFFPGRIAHSWTSQLPSPERQAAPFAPVELQSTLAGARCARALQLAGFFRPRESRGGGGSAVLFTPCPTSVAFDWKNTKQNVGLFVVVGC